MTDPREKPVPAAWRAEIDQWKVRLRSAGRSAETIRTRTDHLRRAARALDGSPWLVSGDQLLGWVGSQEWSRETRRSVYASLRSFWAWGVRSGRCGVSPAAELPSVKPEPPCPRPTPEPVYRRGLAAADGRTWLILSLAAWCAMRRGEIAQVHERDVVEDLGGWSLLVHGKGGRIRITPLPDALVQPLRLACQAGGGWAFPGAIDGHLSAQRVGNLASKALPGVWTLHTLRHRAATVAHDLDHDLLSVKRMLGHASVATTERYVLVRDDRLRELVEHAAA